MNAREDLFRKEALEFHTRGDASSGGVIRLGAPWLRWSFRLLVALVAAGVAIALFAHTDESSTGPAVINGRDGTFSALLPAAVAPQLSSARSFRIRVDGGRELRVDVTRARAIASRTTLDGLPTPTQPSLLLSGRIAQGRADLARGQRVRARAVLVLRRERLGNVLVRQFRFMLGPGGDNT